MTKLRLVLLATTALTLTQLAATASHAQTSPLVVAQAQPKEELGPDGKPKARPTPGAPAHPAPPAGAPRPAQPPAAAPHPAPPPPARGSGTADTTGSAACGRTGPSDASGRAAGAAACTGASDSAGSRPGTAGSDPTASGCARTSHATGAARCCTRAAVADTSTDSSTGAPDSARAPCGRAQPSRPDASAGSGPRAPGNAARRWPDACTAEPGAKPSSERHSWRAPQCLADLTARRADAAASGAGCPPASRSSCRRRRKAGPGHTTRGRHTCADAVDHDTSSRRRTAAGATGHAADPASGRGRRNAAGASRRIADGAGEPAGRRSGPAAAPGGCCGADRRPRLSGRCTSARPGAIRPADGRAGFPGRARGCSSVAAAAGTAAA